MQLSSVDKMVEVFYMEYILFRKIYRMSLV